MASKKITFQFQSIYNLWDFKKEIGAYACDIKPAEFLLTCECSNEDILIAREKYGAVVIEVREKA